MARRIAGSSVNWAGIAERILESERTIFAAFKTKSDQYLRRTVANPESSPPIDWAFYKKSVPIPGLVDKFQKEYDALKIPYPADNYTSKIEAIEKEQMAAMNNFIVESNTRIQGYESELARIAGLIPFDQMTMEDFRDAYPDEALNPIENPTFWPHDESEQEPEPVDEEEH